MKKFFIASMLLVLATLFFLTNCSMKKIAFEIPDISIEEGEILQLDLKKHFSGASLKGFKFEIIGPGNIDDFKYIYSPDFNSAGEYKVEIAAIDSKGKKTNAAFTLRVVNKNREPFIEIENQTVFEEETIELDFKKIAVDPDDDPIEFEIVNGVGSISNGVFRYTAGNEAPKVYRITVKASDNNGGKTFGIFNLAVINVNKPPYIPEISYPENESVDLPGRLTIAWKGSDPDGHNVSYDIYLGAKEPELLSSGINVNYYQIDGLEDSTEYTWKIVAKDKFGGETEGPLWTFTTSSKPLLDWQRCLGGSENDFGSSISETFDGGYILSGYTRSLNGTVSSSSNNDSITRSDGWIVKLDDRGYYQWQRVIESGGLVRANTISQTSDGGYIITGTKSEDRKSDQDLWIMKLNKYSNIQWQKLIGSSDHDSGNSIFQTSDGGYIIAGSGLSSNFEDFSGRNDPDFLILKLDSKGEILWQENFGGSKNDIAYDIKETIDGGFIIVGETSSDDGDVHGYTEAGYTLGNVEIKYPDMWVIKISGDGSLLWSRCVGGKGDDSARSVSETSDGAYIIAGYTNSPEISNGGSYDVSILKISSTGDLIWNKTFGTEKNDKAYSAMVTSSDAIVVSGSTENGESSNTYSLGPVGSLEVLKNDLYLLKVTENGDLLWEETYGGSNEDFGYDIQQTSDGSYIVIGVTTSNDGDVKGNHGKNDIWILKITN